jgi:hypothetical protein
VPSRCAEAVVRSLAVNSVRGDPRAQKLFTERPGTGARDNRRLDSEWLNTAIEYKRAAPGTLAPMMRICSLSSVSQTHLSRR